MATTYPVLRWQVGDVRITRVVESVDPAAAQRMRREFLERYKDGKVLLLGTHFASPTAGRLVREAGAFRFVPK